MVAETGTEPVRPPCRPCAQAAPTRPQKRPPTSAEDFIAAYTALPATAKRSLTWDCGAEMAGHKTVASPLRVYFAHAHSHALGTADQRAHQPPHPARGPAQWHRDVHHLASLAAEINGRPPEILEWKKPSERIAEILAISCFDTSNSRRVAGDLSISIAVLNPAAD